jgi:hypothetical protein
MAQLDHLDHFPSRAARRSVPRGLGLAAAALLLALLAALAPDAPAPNAGGETAGRTVEDWRGNSARVTVLPAH